MKSFNLTLEFKDGFGLNLKSEKSLEVTDAVLVLGLSKMVMETARDAYFDITAQKIAEKNSHHEVG